MSFKHVLIVLKKELKDIFRDRKTIFASLIMPMIMFPILFGFMGQGVKQLMEEGKNAIPIAINSTSTNSLVEYIKNSPEFIIIEDIQDYLQAINDNKIKAVVHISEDFDQKIKSNELAPITLEYDDTSQHSLNAVSTIRAVITRFSDKVVIDRLSALNLNESILQVIDIKEKSAAPDKGGAGFMMFSMMLPLFLTMWSAISGMPAAIDLGAGEKERGTLEPLLTTQPKRLSILMGKFFAVTVAAIMGTLASLAGLFISTKLNPEMLGTFTGIGVASILIIAVICISLSLIFSALQLVISVYARSFKEASTYLSPLLVIIMVPSYLTMFIDAKAIPAAFFNIPLLNSVSLIKEVTVGIFNVQHIIVVLGWSVIYIALSMIFALAMFKKEAVVFRV